MDDALFDPPEQPDLAGACVAAMLAPAIACGLAGLVLTICAGLAGLVIALTAFICALIVAAPHVLVLGLPAYLLARRFTVPGWRLAAACGAILGAGPYLLTAAASGDRLGDDMSAALFLAVMGLIGGISFRWQLYARAED